MRDESKATWHGAYQIMNRTPTPLWIIILGFCSWCCLSAQALAQEGSINWRHNYAAARKEAKEKGRPIILEFGTKQCYWCKRLEQDTFSNSVVAQTINEHFIPLKIDADLEPTLTQALQVQSYPTTVLADQDGKILGTMEGFHDATRFQEKLLRALALVANPEWMIRDYHAANKALATPDYAKAVTLLKGILEDGKNRPIQSKAKALFETIEQQAAQQLVKGKQLNDKGQPQEAVKVLSEVVRLYSGTKSADQAGEMMTSISSTSPEIAKLPRNQQAVELLAQAKEDYKAGQHLFCLDRCKSLMNDYADLKEAKDAKELHDQIASNPEWMQNACDKMADRLGNMHLLLADSYLKKGKRQEAINTLQNMVKMMPSSQLSEVARVRLNQLNGQPTLTVDFKKN